jgi:hypothetical protein
LLDKWPAVFGIFYRPSKLYMGSIFLHLIRRSMIQANPAIKPTKLLL